VWDGVALDPWEAGNALWVLRRHALPLEPLSCPVDQAFLNSITWPVHVAYREAQRLGDGAAMLRIRLQVQRQRRNGAWLGAAPSADFFLEDRLCRIHRRRAADQSLDDLGDRATAADREVFKARIEIEVYFQLKRLGQVQGIRHRPIPTRGGWGQMATIQVHWFRSEIYLRTCRIARLVYAVSAYI